MSEERWIDEQKKNRLFRGSGQGGDAIKMLEISPTNRILSPTQAKKLTAARFINDVLGITCISKLCDMVEAAQLCTDEKSRVEFMKVAIEQWQGKVAAAGKKITLENLA